MAAFAVQASGEAMVGAEIVSDLLSGKPLRCPRAVER
jgi:hypothetical protein